MSTSTLSSTSALALNSSRMHSHAPAPMPGATLHQKKGSLASKRMTVTCQSNALCGRLTRRSLPVSAWPPGLVRCTPPRRTSTPHRFSSTRIKISSARRSTSTPTAQAQPLRCSAAHSTRCRAIWSRCIPCLTSATSTHQRRLTTSRSGTPTRTAVLIGLPKSTPSSPAVPTTCVAATPSAAARTFRLWIPRSSYQAPSSQSRPPAMPSRRRAMQRR
mmetsp:Transcript_50775/g.114190  ORF Transcript_50775/g.114190 Transcript_50775/m.114190 type:complete len:217 (+) Transcript_50775:169-819(+)